jgi:hypothetical protein
MVAQNVNRYMEARAGLKFEVNLLRDDRKCGREGHTEVWLLSQ